VDTTTALLTLASALLGALGLSLWRRSRRLARTLAEATQQTDEWRALLALEHDTNYKMACQLYGRRAVDRAIAQVHEKGVS
jgi:hypothetical protein